MICTPAIQHMIRDRKTHSIYSAIQTGQQFGMRTLDDSLLVNFRRGLLAREEMLRVAEHPGDILQKMGEAVPQHMAIHSQPQNGNQPQQQQRPMNPGGQHNTR